MQLGHSYGPYVNSRGPLLRENSGMAKTTFVERLHDAMVQQGLDGPVQLGKRLGVNKQTASKWIRGETTILAASDLFLIADGLKVSPRWLWTGSGPITPVAHPTPDEEVVIRLYRTLPKGWRDAWVDEGRKTLKLLQLSASDINTYRVPEK